MFLTITVKGVLESEFMCLPFQPENKWMPFVKLEESQRFDLDWLEKCLKQNPVMPMPEKHSDTSTSRDLNEVVHSKHFFLTFIDRKC